MTNESEAMEVWRKANEAYSNAEDPYEADNEAARVIATALEARDAELNDLRHWKLCAEEGLVERDARIAELEGALERFARRSGEPIRSEVRAILTKQEKDHD